MDNKKTGLFIANARKEKSMTQKELAEKLFVTDRAVSKWERGIGYPDITIIGELAKVLDVNINEILYGEKLDNVENETVLKDGINFYKKIQKQSILKKILIIIPVCFIGLWFFTMIFTEVNKGCMPFSNCSVELDDWPSFSKYSNEKIVKKLFKAIQNYDYNTLEEMIFPSDIKITQRYIEEFKYLEEHDVKFISVKKSGGFWGYAGYSGEYDITVEHEGTRGTFNISMIKMNDRIGFGGIIYSIPQELIGKDIWNYIIKVFSIDYEEFVKNLTIDSTDKKCNWGCNDNDCGWSCIDY